jgi:hypothetical protein
MTQAGIAYRWFVFPVEISERPPRYCTGLQVELVGWPWPALAGNGEMELAMGIEPTGKALPELQNKLPASFASVHFDLVCEVPFLLRW